MPENPIAKPSLVIVSIEIFDKTGAKVDAAAGAVVADEKYQVRTQVTNEGAAIAPATNALLLIGTKPGFKTASSGGGGMFVIAGFQELKVINPDADSTVEFPKVVLGTSGSTPSVLVQVSDPMDPVVHPLDAESDPQHVRRLDVPTIG